MSRGVATVDPTKQRKPKRTPWAIYNPAWIKTHQRKPKSPR
jgi:hypothetical protein